MKKLVFILLLLPLLSQGQSLFSIGKQILIETTGRLTVELTRKAHNQLESSIRKGVNNVGKGQKSQARKEYKKARRQERRAWKNNYSTHADSPNKEDSGDEMASEDVYTPPINN